MGMDQLTERQRKIYELIEEGIKEHGFPPTVREIMNILGVKSTSLIHKELMQLEEYGYIQNDPSKPRTIVLKKNLEEQKIDNLMVPVIARLSPDPDSLFDIDEYIIYPKSEKTPRFAYKMKGYSLIEKGIYDKDILFFSDDEPAKDKDIVIALADKATIVAELAHDSKSRTILKPKNKAFHDICPDKCLVAGKLIALLRRY